MKSNIAHKIKHREFPNDNFETPPSLAKKLIGLVPLVTDDVVLDPAVGEGAFYDNFPSFVVKECCDISVGVDFLDYNKEVDWIITNPPYSNLDAWFEKSIKTSEKGFAYLLGLLNITPRRIEVANRGGFYLTQLYLCKVFHWFGISAFAVFSKNGENIISFDRIVWR